MNAHKSFVKATIARTDQYEYHIAKVWPQERADENNAPSRQAWGSPRKEQEGSGRPPHHVPNLFVIFMIPFRSFSELVCTKTIRTLTHNDSEQKAPLLKAGLLLDSALTADE